MSTEVETIRPTTQEKVETAHVDNVGEYKDAANMRADAMEAENAEHRMSVTEAVKAYPWACFWAFVMSSTIIVRLASHICRLKKETRKPLRSGRG